MVWSSKPSASEALQCVLLPRGTIREWSQNERFGFSKAMSKSLWNKHSFWGAPKQQKNVLLPGLNPEHPYVE
jgi:hypothetical protein